MFSTRTFAGPVTCSAGPKRGPPASGASRGASKPKAPVRSKKAAAAKPKPASRPFDPNAPKARAAVATGKKKSRLPTTGPVDYEKERHKYFDEVTIRVRSGAGGDGEITEQGKGRWVDNFKYRPGGSLPKRIWLSASEPADGMDGGDVVLVVDPEYDDLMHLQNIGMMVAKKGSNGDPNIGSQAPKSMKRQRLKQEDLVIPVPPGTSVRRKSGGPVTDLIQPGQRYVLLEGGRGGMGVVAPTREDNSARVARSKEGLFDADEVVLVEDANWKEDTAGGPGGEATVTLTLRVVADVGLVGLPNAGKSSLLAALTRADPEIAPYPFTTLMPNLGVIEKKPAEPSAPAEPSQDAEGEFDWANVDWSTVDPAKVDEMINKERAASSGKAAKAPILADLPGLIEGAHMGRGLGRMFLRHLKRTRVLLQVLDGTSPHVDTDYLVVREELRMYNPEYTRRPHVVALNKVDLLGEDNEETKGFVVGLVEQIEAAARRVREEQPEDAPSLPLAVVPVSALHRGGLAELERAIDKAIAESATMPLP